MARQSANSLLNSLKGKIWLATSALALFICTFGLISYLIVSFAVEDTFYAVFIPFLFLAFTVMVFGWWLSNEVVGPIEKVSLLAKSLERGSTSTLPKTSGSAETDELLESLHRSSLQMQKLVGLMDEVASGNTDVVLTPLQNSDRLSSSFQKLLAKVTDSIHAKQELEKLQNAVDQITEDISEIRKGNLDTEITTDFAATKEITETFRYLIRHLNDLVSKVRNDTQKAQNSAVNIRKNLQNVILKDESKVEELNQVKQTLKQIPAGVQKISEELFNSALTANQSIEKAQKGNQIAQENVKAVNQVRKQVQEAVKLLQNLNEYVQEIGKIAETVEDLSHRTNMIALNTSIQAAELGEKGRGFSVVAEEIERLAARADNTTTKISSLNKSISAEIGEIEHSLQSTISGVADLSKFAIETGNTLNELEKYVGQFLNLQDKLVSFSHQQSNEGSKAFEVFVKSISETEKSVTDLKQSEMNLVSFAASLESLQSSIVDFQLPQTISQTVSLNNGYSDFAHVSEPKSFELRFEENE